MAELNQSVQRAAAILRFLSKHEDVVGVSEIARNVGLGKATTHRLLSTLCQVDLVRSDRERGRYGLGFGLIRLTAEWLGGMEVRHASQPELRKLRQQTGETVVLNIRDADMLVPIERLDTRQAIRHIVELGRPQPLHLGAGGKAILAFLPVAEIDDLLATTGPAPARADSVRDELSQIRKDGFAISRGEVVPGACAISAPVFDRDSAAIASISMLCLESTLDPEMAVRFGHFLQESAATVSARLGCPDAGAAPASQPERRADAGTRSNESASSASAQETEGSK